MKIMLMHILSMVFINIPCIYSQELEESIQLKEDYFNNISALSLDKTYTLANKIPSIISEKKQWNSDKKDSLIYYQILNSKSNIGLKFISRGRLSGTNILMDDATDNNIRNTIQFGIEWDLLQSGVQEQKKYRKLLENSYDIAEKESLIAERNIDIHLKLIAIHRYFDQLIYKQLIIQKESYNRQLKLLLSLYYQHLVPYREILEIKKQILTLEVSIEHIESKYIKENITAFKNSEQEIKLFDLDENKLKEFCNNDKLFTQISYLKQQRVQLEYDSKIQKTLKIQTSMQFFEDNNNTLSSNPVVGFSLKIPIILKNKENKEIALKKDGILFNAVQEKKERWRTLQNLIELFKKNLKKINEIDQDIILSQDRIIHYQLLNKTLKEGISSSSFAPVNRILSLKITQLELIKDCYLLAANIGSKVDDPSKYFKTYQPKTPENSSPFIYIQVDVNKLREQPLLTIGYLKRKRFLRINLVGNPDSNEYKLSKHLLQEEGFIVKKPTDKATVIQIQNKDTLELIDQYINNAITEKQTIIIQDIHQVLHLAKSNIP